VGFAPGAVKSSVPNTHLGGKERGKEIKEVRPTKKNAYVERHTIIGTLPSPDRPTDRRSQAMKRSQSTCTVVKKPTGIGTVSLNRPTKPNQWKPQGRRNWDKKNKTQGKKISA